MSQPKRTRGDRVRILHSIYKGHPSRMAGGTGTITRADAGAGQLDAIYVVALDNDSDLTPEDAHWTFEESELEPLT